MKSEKNQPGAIFGRLRIRLLGLLVIAVLVVVAPLHFYQQAENLSQRLSQEYQYLAHIIDSTVAASGSVDAANEQVKKLIMALPDVISVKVETAAENQHTGRDSLWFDVAETNQRINIVLAEDRFRESGAGLIVFALTMLLVLSAGWLVAGYYSGYLSNLATFISTLRSGGEVKLFNTSSSVHELNALSKSVNHLSERVYVQSLAIKRGFEDINTFTELYEHSPSLIVSLNTELEVSYLNKAYKNVLPEKYLEADVLAILPEEITELVNKSIVDNVIIRGIETRVDDHIIVWSIVPIPVRAVVNCYGVDITEMRLAESETETAYVDSMIARDQNEAKSIFLANMSHEIRTPLTAILGFSEALLDSTQSMEERVVSINTIIRNARHLLAIINDLLDITKIESGQTIVDLQSVSVKDVFQDVYQNYSAEARSKGIGFNLDIEYPLPAYVVSDENRIRQIIFNICSNAMKFTETGSVTFSARYNIEDSLLEFMIKDTGLGMDPASVDKIFNRFEQLDNGHARKYGGAGLGLYITHELVERLGGSIAVESELGVGSQFFISIKAETVSAEIIDSDINLHENQVESSHSDITYKGNVLLVEDNVDNQNLIKMYLTKLGANVALANNGKEAVEKAAAAEYDLILMDMQMPVMDGVEATRKINATGDAAPIVMLTANVMKEDMQACRSVGCKGFITKPVKRESFERYVKEFLTPFDSPAQQLQPIVSDLVNEGPEFYNIVKAYIKQLPDDLENVVEAFKSDDGEVLKRKVHSMKGTSGNMGFIEFSQICSKIEFAITKDDREEIEQLIHNLEEMKLRILAGADE